MLVGGFSASEYLFKRVDVSYNFQINGQLFISYLNEICPAQAQFGGRIKVIARPSDADTATARGAAAYGLAHRPLVSSVIAAKAYIMKVFLPTTSLSVLAGYVS